MQEIETEQGLWFILTNVEIEVGGHSRVKDSEVGSITLYDRLYNIPENGAYHISSPVAWTVAAVRARHEQGSCAIRLR